MEITAVTCVKNEGPYLLEWLAYHRMIGVTRFLIYSNDCSDGSDRLLDALAGPLNLSHLPNPATGRHYQMEALRAARQHPAVREADWVWISDVDEFLNVHCGDHSIPALIRACGATQAISPTFRFFANGGVNRFKDRLVTEQFTRCHAPDIWAADTAIEVKTLVRKDFPLHHFGAHRPFLRGTGKPLWVDGSGRPVPDAFLRAANNRRLRRFPALGAQKLATLNHYALRSREAFLIKRDRGDVNRPNRAFDVDYWADRNDGAQEDRRILRHVSALQAAMDDLRRDPEVDALHRAAVAWHKSRAKALRASAEGAALWSALGQALGVPAAEAALCAELGLVPG